MRAIFVGITIPRPVRLQAAKDIATTRPFYAAKSFKALGFSAGKIAVDRGRRPR